MAKTRAEKIQYQISRRLNEMKKREAKPGDIAFLWGWTHKLYELALEFEGFEKKLDEIEQIAKTARK
jgi:hypothetical protein